MRITAKIDYAVRACVELAAAWDSAPGAAPRFVKAESISHAQAAPDAFVLGILNQLKRAGLVVSRRGADGGYCLAHPPESIVVADVVRAIDGPLANVAGSYVEDVSYAGAAAPVRDVWVALRAAMRSVLDTVSLADIAGGELPPDVRRLLADETAWSTRPHGRETRVRGR
ncbi:RrF2 family transcriptional regulator [Oerskovia flava]|uniref:RrF2 family transcriptional regulator n=1 Tax=Oerskovia flava TaxID=2986422 RepID=UPI0022408D75|nr:Rrf2 family transcriptional regulator [Oerskovia sp. JB1-3-2]